MRLPPSWCNQESLCNSSLPSFRGVRPSLASLLVCLLLLCQIASADVLPEEDDYYDSYEADEDDEQEEETVTEASRAVVLHRETRQSSNAYYDFIITEYSYKIWVVFMIYAMINVFYACLVAAYFAETNTLAPTQAFDYDYVIKRSVYGEEATNTLDSPLKISRQGVDHILRSISSTPEPLSTDESWWGAGRVERKKKHVATNIRMLNRISADPT
ncbi:uncharacterized protein LOC124153701 [Ischnura elegans]|uniref:uncharacterized protein LOC124153701 n=1 Tax=Ischnura elegans TaxID=197161 RepID=UPI001ED8706F|nr:uncharacterized protein LOC124153701 [Ischnura elegans]